jgi:predicted nucleotidyltransferase
MDAVGRLKSLGVDRKRLAELCDRWKIAEVALFGSALRDDFRPDSDVDLLVTYRADAEWSLFDTVGLDVEFSELFRRRVDVVSRRAVEASENWIRRKAILESAVSIYAA